ncbi:Major fimbrial subunit protein type IV, Fimbrillin, C-terminal [Alistipes timonensis JC136]|uniref:Major fimbrial subunit protein type IV, Fimbrillin, C-terminal n=1 Tax=Alistipes timonensis JC136 TaxID=1033731 RepID=A0A1H3Z333_9BACT|nr:Major fimbrial subunit protein type IV, Fimbrillin, C-terminal [Alistipes timonensis JC136]
MKMKKLFFGLFACASLCACSNDESGVIPDDTPKVFTGDEAYINVRLADAGSLTRAQEGEFEYGTNEQSVKNAFFYFYDADGVFVAQGDVWTGGNASTTNPAGNIEFTGNNVVVLKELGRKNYPKYMVAVLNKPTGFLYGNTLGEMQTVLADGNAEGIYYPSTANNVTTDYFTMSTTSYTEAGRSAYFVTEVKEENFLPEPMTDINAIANTVTVYVERLAAKVTLNVSEQLVKDANGRYPIKATVAGEDNSAGNDDVASEELYVELLGWKLNATAKRSYMVKNIDATWANGDLGFTWNRPTDYRSHWGKSFNYGLSGYPDNAAGVPANSEYLNYVDLENGLTALGAPAYCAENTNTSAVVTADFPSAVTSILLKAKVCDASGNALDLVRYNGVLFRHDSFLEYVLSVLKARNQHTVWYENGKDAQGNTKYTQIGKEYVKLENTGDGEVKAVFTNELEIPLYAEDGSSCSEEIIDVLNDDLAAASAGAVAYNGGLMYYNIPIEHLNNDAAENGTVPEAKYGVVRNHHYVVTIDKLEKIGKGIFDGNEKIVPGDPNDDTYYVGAKINILSWKIVSQNVEL